MKKTFLLAVAFFCALSVQAQITFETGTWEEVKAKAKKAKKMIFVDAYTTWCGPCKWLSANVFTDKGVGEYHNSEFINYKVDMEKGEGPQLAQTFKVSAYPTLLYLNKEGELVHRLVGALPADQFLEKSKEATKPDFQYYTLRKKFEKGERKSDFLLKIAKAAESASIDDANAIFKEYVKSLPKKDWEKPENLAYISKSANSFESEEFKFLEQNKDKLTGDLFQQTVFGLLDVIFSEAVKKRDEAMLSNMKTKVTKYLPDMAEKLNKNIDTQYASLTGNTQKVEEAMAESQDWQELNGKAWDYYQSQKDPAKLEIALGWAKKSIELEENFYNTDTYAHLAYKLGKKEEALKFAKKAVELGKKAGEETKETEKLIMKIESEK